MKTLRSHHYGMTLIELMVVVAIIMLLSSILVYFVSGNREKNAQVDMTNDLVSLINAQRARAISLNVATYIRFNPQNVEPRLGTASSCSPALAQQLPIRYFESHENTDNVAIDFELGGDNLKRALDSQDSQKYFTKDTPLVTLQYALVNTNQDPVDTQDVDSFAVCFQPNGFVYFIRDNAFNDNFTFARIDVQRIIDGAVDTTQKIRIQLSSLGAVESTGLIEDH